MLGTSKKVPGFSSNRKLLMSLLSMLFHLQNCVSVFLNFNFYSRYLEKRSLCPWNQLHFLRKSDKSLLSPEQNKLKKSETRFCRRKTANAKIKVSLIYLVFFSTSELVAFLQFPRNLLFWQVLRMSVFFNSKRSTFLYLFISLLKNIH